MNGIPSLWRIELLHPVLVHFAVGLLVPAAGVRALSVLLRNPERRHFLAQCSRLMLFLGVLGAWSAFISGGEAEDVVNKVICDPTITKVHENWALGASLGFSALLALELGLSRVKAPWAQRLGGFMLGLWFAGAAAIGWAGHLGASLVYQQGAAVYKPNAECKGFE